jgi:hypothetical protein
METEDFEKYLRLFNEGLTEEQVGPVHACRLTPTLWKRPPERCLLGRSLAWSVCFSRDCQNVLV